MGKEIFACHEITLFNFIVSVRELVIMNDFPRFHYFSDLYLHEIESYHIVEYRKQRLQEKSANRKNLVNPGTVNREVGLLISMINLASEK